MHYRGTGALAMLAVFYMLDANNPEITATVDVNNLQSGVNWIHSSVSPSGHRLRLPRS